jgi:predicted small lipoprotein YifL
MSMILTRRAFHLLAVALLAFALAATLSACGKKGDLEEPKNEKIQFPRNYPR